MQYKLIYDNYHGNIEFSNLESKFLRSPLINRLHQILQNSTAYLVYPCCKTSRFEHSIGVMDYASKIFQNGLVNSLKTVEYLNDKYSIIQGILKKIETDFNDDEGDFNDIVPENDEGWGSEIIAEIKEVYKVKNFDDILTSKDFKKEIVNIVGKEFVQKNIFFKYFSEDNNDEVLDTKNESVLILLNQTIRLFGMLHDVGHLPFSHVYEYALENLFDYYGKKTDKNKNEKKFYKDIKNILVIDGVENGDKNVDKIHELLGKQLVSYIFKDLIKKEKSSPEKSSSAKLLVLKLIKSLFLETIKGKSSKLFSLYNIVSGSLDVDRLDFIQRDGSNSGLSIATGNIDRIIKMICLTERPTNKEKYFDKYIFLPAIQTIHDVEEVLRDRYKIYKYMVNHHAVKRSDHIFQKIIEKKIKDELINDHEYDSDNIEVSFLNETITISKDLLTKNNITKSYKRIIYRFFQLTDFWLLSILNKVYIDLLVNKKDEDYRIYLSEIYENSRNFQSLWKRGYDYGQFLIKLSNNFLKDRKGVKYFKSLENKFLELYKKDIVEVKYALDIANLLKKLNYKDEESLKILGSLIISFFADKNEKFGWLNKIEEILVKDDFVFLVAGKKLKNGIDDLWLVDNKDQKIIKKFEEISVLKQSINLDIDKSTAFYIYFYSKNRKNRTSKRNEIEDFAVIKIKELFIKEIENFVAEKF